MEKQLIPIVNELKKCVEDYGTLLHADGGLYAIAIAKTSDNYSIENLKTIKNSLHDSIQSLRALLVQLLEYLDVTEITLEQNLLSLMESVENNINKIKKKMKKLDLNEIFKKIKNCCTDHEKLNDALIYNKYWLDKISSSEYEKNKILIECQKKKLDFQERQKNEENIRTKCKKGLAASRAFFMYLSNIKSELILRDVKYQLNNTKEYKVLDKSGNSVLVNIDMIKFLRYLYWYNINLKSSKNIQKLKNEYLKRLSLSKFKEDKNKKVKEVKKPKKLEELKYKVDPDLVRRLIFCDYRLKITYLSNQLKINDLLLQFDDEIKNYINHKLNKYNYLNSEEKEKVEKFMGKCVNCKYKLYYLKHLHLLNYKNLSKDNFFAKRATNLDENFIQKHDDIIKELKKNEDGINRIFGNFFKKKSAMKIFKLCCKLEKVKSEESKRENEAFQTYLKTYLDKDEYYLDNLDILNDISDKYPYKIEQFDQLDYLKQQLVLFQQQLKKHYKTEIENLEFALKSSKEKINKLNEELQETEKNIDLIKPELARRCLEKYLVNP